MRYTLLVVLLSVSPFLLTRIKAQDVTISLYFISDPSDASQISYNRVTDTTITFTVTVDSGASGGDVDGIDVYFVDSSDTKISGTEQAAGGSAPTSGSPNNIAATQSDSPLSSNTVTIKFSNEADCTAASKLCVLIKGNGVDTSNAQFCLNVGVTSGDAGDKDCTDPPTPTPQAMSTDGTNPGTTNPMGTPGTTKGSGADTVAAYLAMPLLMSFVLAMHMVMTF
ncbi:uncharacterized protein [Ptychodera flava]|uniref:uncharacterized protein n=1 Tax=Ptychodera flava TaxID=63121 RepID=UPI00396A2EAA